MQRIFIHLSVADNQSLAEWALYKDAQRIAAGNGPSPLPDVQKTIPASGDIKRQVILFISSEYVLHTKADIPKKQKRYASRIVPFLIEDQLAEPVQDYHIAYNARLITGEDIEVLAINLEKFSEWLAQLEACGLKPDEAFSDLQFIDAADNTMTVMISGKKCWIRSGKYVALCTESEALPEVLKQVQRQSPTINDIKYITCAPDGNTTSYADTLKATIPVKTFNSISTDGIFAYLINNYLFSNTPERVNLLQGKFKKTSPANSAQITRHLLKIAAAWFFTMLAINAGQVTYYYIESKYYREQTLTLYKQFFPADTKIIDPRKQAETHLSSPHLSSGFLSIMNKVSLGLSGYSKLAGSAKTMSYEDVSKQLVLTLQADSVEIINKLMEQLRQAGVNGRIQSVMNNASGIIGVIELSEAAP